MWIIIYIIESHLFDDCLFFVSAGASERVRCKAPRVRTKEFTPVND